MVATAYAVEMAPTLTLSASPTASPLVLRDLPLPMEAHVLKESIRKSHPSKCFSFSLLHMRKVAVPPVPIPIEYRTSKLKAMRVGGHEVPFTRLMWERTKRAVFPRGNLEPIRENPSGTLHRLKRH